MEYPKHLENHIVGNFWIDCRSIPGFSGTDSLVIDVVFGWQGRRNTDNNTVTVDWLYAKRLSSSHAGQDY